MTEGRFECRVERRIWQAQDIAIYVGMRDALGLSIAQPPTFERITPGALANPMLSITSEDAQALMDELWRAGLRPTEGTGSAGALAAVQKHLQDMRRIALQGIPSTVDREVER